MKANNKSKISNLKNDVDNLSPGLFGKENKIDLLLSFYRDHRPFYDDSPEVFGEKLDHIDNVVDELSKIANELIQNEAQISELMVVTRVLPPLEKLPYVEVRPIRGGSAELGGTPLNITGSRNLLGHVKPGDVAFISKANGVAQMVDIDANYNRPGQLCTVTEILEGKQFNYELEVEGGRFNDQKICALKWQRLDCEIKKGDKVYVNCGVIYEIAKSTSGRGGRFAMTPRTDLKKTDLRGDAQQKALTHILAAIDRHFSNGKYPARSKNFSGDKIMLCGPQGSGKNFAVATAVSAACNKYSPDKIYYQVIEGAAIYDSLVGSGQAKLRELRENAIKALSEGKLPITHITEAGSAIVSRETAGNYLDSGSARQLVDQLLSIADGPNPIPGLLILDFNSSESVSRALKDRFMIFFFPHISAGLFTDIIKSIYDREENLFEGEWQNEILPAIKKALSTQLGSVLIGKDGQVPVTAANVITGRAAQNSVKYALNLLDHSIYTANENSIEPLFTYITPAILYYAIVHAAHGLFSTWSLSDARNRLVPELIKPEKASSISHPEPTPWAKIDFDTEYDCRAYFEACM